MNTYLGMTANKLARIASDLDVENAKLREENERLVIKLNAEHIVRQNVELVNARLWELVQEMYEFMSIAEDLDARIKLSPNEPWSFANRISELRTDMIHSPCRDARKDSSSA